ncbi:Outer membrane protein TolC [Zhouia amylolytica]|uniref:Outer membrane protein TolC n=1 Tax=Zhouia amylolytica TaxID=376730 RepID=A0A1I6UFK2_9FLAO|nr:TolC family protein [Zhouia amylolytica]SFT00269.1 Outer membrane protein TolC [Zhouia amylolytica]
MKGKILIVVITTILYGNKVLAQEEVAISKSHVLEMISERNMSLKISQYDYKGAQADYRQSNTLFLPNISISYTGMATTNPLMAFGAKLNQEVLTQNDFNPVLLNDPDQVENYATVIEVQQPLINLDGLYQRKAAKATMEAVNSQTKRTEDYLILEAEKAYMQLQLAYKAVAVIKKAQEAAEENLKIAQNSFRQGYLQKSDVLAVEVRVSEVQNQLQQAKSNVKNASDYLAFLMDEKTDEIYIPKDSLVVNASIEQFKEELNQERADIKAMEFTTEAFKQNYKADKMAFLPSLNAFGSYELYDDEIFNAGANGYVFGAQLKWDILEGSSRFGKSQKSKALYEKSKLEYAQYVSQSELELNKIKRKLLDAKNKLELTYLALQQSEESLRIRTNRFEEGLEKTSDLLLSESKYAQKQLEYYQTVFEFNYTQSYLQFLTKE